MNTIAPEVQFTWIPIKNVIFRNIIGHNEGGCMRNLRTKHLNQYIRS